MGFEPTTPGLLQQRLIARVFLKNDEAHFAVRVQYSDRAELRGHEKQTGIRFKNLVTQQAVQKNL